MTVFWIARRELGSLFGGAMGWLVLAGFLLITGVFWVFGVEDYAMISASAVYNPYDLQGLSLTNNLLLPFFGNCTVVVLMVTPALAMRLFSEELRSHTLELLLTSPISSLEIVLGKYLGAVAALAVLLASTLHVPISLGLLADPDPGVLAGGYTALFLLGSAILAMGMCISAWTSNQVVSLLVTFVAALTLYVVSFSETDPEALLNQISISTHVIDLIRGALRTRDLAWFAGFIGFFLFATHQRLESVRWR